MTVEDALRDAVQFTDRPIFGLFCNGKPVCRTRSFGKMLELEKCEGKIRIVRITEGSDVYHVLSVKR